MIQEESLAEPIWTEDYSGIMKKKLVRIEEFYEKERLTENKNVTLDQIVEFSKIENSPIDNCMTLFSSEHKTEICLKDLMLLFFYRNISQALTEFVDYINFDPEILRLMANKDYEKYHYGIAKVIHQH